MSKAAADVDSVHSFPTPSLAEATAAILAGGLGTRLRQVVPDRQKVIAEVSGRPFVTYLLDQVSEAGIEATVMCTGYGAEQVRKFFGSTYASLRLEYSAEPSPLGTGGALRLALPRIGSEWVVAMNGDSFCAVDLSDVWAWHHSQHARASLVVIQRDDAAGFGRVTLGSGDRVTGFEEKSDRPGAAWVNAGIYILHRSLIESIPAGRPVSLEREMFPRWLTNGVYAYRSQSRFIDIGTPDSYARAHAFMEHAAV